MKIAFILSSNGLEYDDRIRKEMFSIRKILGDVKFKIFAFCGDDNHSGTGVLSYGVPYEFVSVAHRESRRKDIISMFRKEYSFYSQVAKRVKGYDLLWCIDDHPFFFPLFSRKPVIWDLHEIPENFIGSRLKKKVFHRMERRAKWLIHANNERKNFLIRHGVIIRPEKHIVIRNYPDNDWLEEGEKNTDSFNRFKEWLGNDEYMYVQGISLKGRFAWETLSAIMEVKRIKVVVVGKVPEEVKEMVRNKYPDSSGYIYYTGQVFQLDTAAFMAHCKFSMVFYKTDTPNNRYCEPNRMFQCLGMGKPVIVGCNEPMKNVVGKYGNGLAINTDGNCVEDNITAINQMLDHYDMYYKSAEQNKHVFTWESQIEKIKLLFK